MFESLRRRWSGLTPVKSPSIQHSGRSLNHGASHDAVDLAQEVASRYGWTEDTTGRIFDDHGKQLIADDLNDLVRKMLAEVWITGSGSTSRIQWDNVPNDSTKAVKRLLEN